MSIKYAKFTVAMHGMDLQTAADLLRLRDLLDRVVREYVHPGGSSIRFDSDVEVEIEESAGLGRETPGAPGQYTPT